MSKKIATEFDTRGALSVDCSECERGGNRVSEHYSFRNTRRSLLFLLTTHLFPARVGFSDPTERG